MAECLNTIYWAEGPLVVEVPYKSDYIIVEDSDVDESPSAKAARNQRREAIGRRYLLGHVPLIQTASLKGPFGSKCGWVAPWRHIKARPEDREPKIITKNQHRAITIHEVMHTEFATLGSGNIATVSMDEDTIRYDADNEDDTFEDINDVKNNLYMEIPDDTIGEHIRISHDEAYLHSAEYGTSDNSENNFLWPAEQNKTKSRGGAGRAFLQNERKRKRGAGWLKGENALKRSRYETLEHSSPTPIAGTTRVGIIGVKNGPILAKSDLQVASENHCLPVKQILNTGQAMVDAEATNDSTSFRVASKCQKEISLDEKEEGERILWRQQKQSTAQTFEYSTGQQAVLAQNMEKQQLDPPGSPSSDLDAEVVRSLNSVLCMLPQRVGSVSLQAQAQNLEKVVHGDSAISGILDNDSINESHLDNKMTLHELTSPASEESFHYRKTKRKSQRQKMSLRNYEKQGANDDIDEIGGERGSESIGRDAQHLQPANNITHGSIHHIIPENEDLETSSAKKRRKNRHRQLHRSKSSENIPAALSELGEASSPDPLCREIENYHAQELTTENNSRSEMSGAKSLQDDVAKIDCQRTVVAQAIPITFQEEIGSQAPAFQRLSEESVPSISGDHVEISSNPSLSIQRQFRHSHTKPTDLLARIGGVGDVPPATDFLSHGKLLSQQESPMVNNASDDLSLNLQPSDVESTKQLSLKGNAEAARSDDQCHGFEPASIQMLPELEPESGQELARSVQSPWIAARLASVSSPNTSLDYGPHSTANGNNNTTKRRLQNMPLDNEGSAVLSPRVDCLPLSDTDHKNEEESLQPFRSHWENSGKSSNEMGKSPSRFPSTQILVDAATMNPWNSAFKKTSRRKSDKRVSFGVLPFDDVDSVVRGASLESSRPIGSPPPPAGTLRLTQLDDPFHHRLRATRDLEVTEESLTKFMNTPWDEIPPISSRTKPPSSSPAVVAMADAFIAADQQSHLRKVNGQKISNNAIFPPATAKLIGNLKQFHVLPASSPKEFNSSPPADASFSIDPNGKVTAVSIEPPGHDAEDNLHAVIEDMGSFLAGWDVESELRKVKGHKGEKGGSISGGRKREYLSGVSNR